MMRDQILQTLLIVLVVASPFICFGYSCLFLSIVKSESCIAYSDPTAYFHIILMGYAFMAVTSVSVIFFVIGLYAMYVQITSWVSTRYGISNETQQLIVTDPQKIINYEQV